MTRRQESIYTLLIILMVSLGSYAAWTYSIPNHYPTLSSLFPKVTAVALAEPAVAQPKTDLAPPAAVPQPSSAYVLGYHTEESNREPVAIPILMYHKVNPYYEGGLYRIFPEEFDWQMQYLKDNGYHTVSIDAVLDHFQKGQPLPEKSVVITLDDGYRDNYLYAFPILQKYGFTATIFVVTNTVAPEEVNNMMLTWNQIREMAASGITIGCHTVDHAQLTRVGLEEARRQIADAKNVLEEELGKKVDIFSYPYGSHNSDVENLVKESGFRAATTVNPEPVVSLENPFTLNRMGIYSNLSRDGFIEKLNDAQV